MSALGGLLPGVSSEGAFLLPGVGVGEVPARYSSSPPVNRILDTHY